MSRGLSVELHLRPGIANDGFVAEAVGNLAAFDLARRRAERLEWQILRVETSAGHHFRLVIRHPERPLDLGVGHELQKLLAVLAQEASDALRSRYLEAQRVGLQPVRLRHVHEKVDFWQDDFWNHIG
jgi:hypothetical protein